MSSTDPEHYPGTRCVRARCVTAARRAGGRRWRSAGNRRTRAPEAACFARRVVSVAAPAGRESAKNLLWAAGKAATLLGEQHVDIHVIQRNLGHARVTATRIYTEPTHPLTREGAGLIGKAPWPDAADAAQLQPEMNLNDAAEAANQETPGQGSFIVLRAHSAPLTGGAAS